MSLGQNLQRASQLLQQRQYAEALATLQSLAGGSCIEEHAGGEGAIIVQKIKEGEGNFGYNARTEVFEDLLLAGVIDPTKVSRVALENAASIAGMLLTTECVISDIPEEEGAPAMPAGMPGGMGGMM